MEVNICSSKAATDKWASELQALTVFLNLPTIKTQPGEFRHGSKDHYSPEYLLDHGIILVTINYRLGVLGE